jgi:hypothetical protein
VTSQPDLSSEQARRYDDEPAEDHATQSPADNNAGEPMPPDEDDRVDTRSPGGRSFQGEGDANVVSSGQLASPEDDDLDDDDLADDDLEDDDLVVVDSQDVTVVESAGLAEPPGDAAESEPAAGDQSAADSYVADNDLTDEEAAVAEDPSLSANGHSEMTQEWHDIQAMFVDDPSGAVEVALQAVDTELTTFIDGLRARQAALAPNGSPDDTERLRTALRSCRDFWQNLTDLGDNLRGPGQSPATASAGGEAGLR